MKLFTFSKRTQYMTGIYQVIAQDEGGARALLRADGHSSADNPVFFELESIFTLEDGHAEGIPFTLEVGNEGYNG